VNATGLGLALPVAVHALGASVNGAQDGGDFDPATGALQASRSLRANRDLVSHLPQHQLLLCQDPADLRITRAPDLADDPDVNRVLVRANAVNASAVNVQRELSFAPDGKGLGGATCDRGV
jgi:hypothetical protein